MRALILTTLLALPLIGCGVDGPPVPPEPKQSRPGVSVGLSGSAEVGVVVR